MGAPLKKGGKIGIPSCNFHPILLLPDANAFIEKTRDEGQGRLLSFRRTDTAFVGWCFTSLQLSIPDVRFQRKGVMQPFRDTMPQLFGFDGTVTEKMVSHSPDGYKT